MNQKRHEEEITAGLCSLFAIPGIITPEELKAGLRRYEAELSARGKRDPAGVAGKSETRERTNRRKLPWLQMQERSSKSIAIF